MVSHLLSELLDAVGLPGPVEKLLEGVLGELADDRKVSLKRAINQRVEVQAGINGARLFARAATKQIDALAAVKMRGVDLGQKAQIAEAIAEVAALKLTQAAKLLTEFAPLSAHVEALKAEAEAIGDQMSPERIKLAALLREARKARDAKRDELRLALEGAFKATMGEWS